MTSFTMLNNVDHKDTRVITERSARYGDAVMFTMTFPFEFRSVQAFYPILFHRDQRGEMYPVALFGFEAGENLFLDDTGWRARYVPAMVRRQPFLIGFSPPSAQGQAEPQRMLSLDMSHPRVSQEQGERLFQPLGGRTPFLEEMAGLLETIYQGSEQNRKFIAALQELSLIEHVTFDIALPNGTRNQLLGFFAVDEDKVRGLTDAALGQLSRNGFLMPLFMMLASTANLRTLVDLKSARLQA